MKYQLKPGIFIIFNGQTFNAATITDAIAEAYLEVFPKGVQNFSVLPEVTEAPEKKPKSKKK